MFLQLLCQRIDATIASLIRTPGGPYRIPPHAMENLLILLDTIRQSILAELNPGTSNASGYGEFLYDNGFGTLKATTRLLPQPQLSEKELNALEQLNSLWHDYLSANNRLPKPTVSDNTTGGDVATCEQIPPAG